MARMVEVQEMIDKINEAADDGDLDDWKTNFAKSVKSQAERKGVSALSDKQIEHIEKIYKQVTA